MKNVFLSFCLTACFCLSAALATAQKSVQASPSASVSQVVGLTKITVDYASPGVKGRKVWGDLVPYAQAWRAGANSPTKLSFDSEVRIGGVDVPAGSYSLFLTPNAEGEWVFHLNGKGKSVFDYQRQDGSMDQDKVLADDIATVKVKPLQGAFRERLSYEIEMVDEQQARIFLNWDQVRVPLDIALPTAKLKEQSVVESLKESEKAWRTYMNAAQFYAATDKAKAMELIDKSVALRPAYFWNQWVKAGMLQQQGQVDAALDLLTKALKDGQTAPDGAFNFFKAQMEKDLSAWKGQASKKWLKANRAI